MQKNTKEPRGLRDLDWDDLRYFLQVARTQTASGAARRLGVDHTTVARRIRELEAALSTVLFDKSRSGGFVLTVEGQRLLGYADAMETTVQSASEQFAGGGQSLAGHVRIGSTEGFGSFFLAPQLARFAQRHPDISLDLLPVPHFISLSKREADIAVLLERPERGQYIHTKLCDYRLRLYCTPDYLKRNPEIERSGELRGHAFVNYVADLVFSPELLYLDRAIPGASANFCSTSIVAQYQAALQGSALAVIPCFMAEPDSRLIAIRPDEISITRHFWLCCREDLRKLRRVAALWDYLREAAEANRGLLMGDSPVMHFPSA